MTVSMNGIDISSWQKGIDLSKVPCDFVIIKATQGYHYVNEDMARAYSQAVSNNKCIGFYHYAEGKDPVAEAQHFIATVGNRVGEALLILDWEMEQNPLFGVNDFAWVKQWMEYVKSVTNVIPVLYTSAGYMKLFNNLGNYPLWIAQYPDFTPTGYKETPWNEGAYDCAIRQYTSVGRLPGYDGNLDLNKFYGTKEDWINLAAIGGNGEIKKEKTNIDMSSTTLNLAIAVMSGKLGSGISRKAKLGNRYDEVQNFINHIFFASDEELANEVLDGKYGSGDDRRTVLGPKYESVQETVNRLVDEREAYEYYTVTEGDTYCSIATKFGTICSKLAEMNKIDCSQIPEVESKIRIK